MTLAKPRKGPPAKGGPRGLPAPIEWRSLCEPFRADHLCNAVKINLANLVRHRYPTLLHEVLRSDLVVPAERYLEDFWPPRSPVGRADLQACRELIDYAEKLADMLEEGHPFSEHDIEDYPASLRRVWGSFIEHSAGAYAQLHEQLQRSQRASGPRKGKSPDGPADTAVTPNALVEWMKMGALVELTEGEKAHAASYFGVSRRTIARRYADARALRLLP